MELDDFKQAWKQSPVNKTTNTDIMDIIRHKSYGPIAAMKREFRKQIAIMTILPICLLLSNSSDMSKPLSSVMFWSYVAFCMGVILFSIFNYRIVSKMDSMDGMVRQNLEQKIGLLETRLRQSIIGLRMVMLFFIVLTEVLPYFQDFRMLNRWHSLSPFIRFGAYALLLLFQYFVSRKITYRKFGRHLEYMKGLVKEMQ